VAFKQLVPEHTVTLFKGIVKVRVKHFPAMFLLVNTLSGPIFGMDVTAVLAWLGFFSSWTYLRFYKRSFPDLGSNQAPSLKGDASEIFAMSAYPPAPAFRRPAADQADDRAYFFPDPLHTPVALLATVVYNVLLALRVCTPFSAADVSASNSQAQARDSANLTTLLGPHSGARVGSARAEAERRRALALKALDQQLHAAANKNSTGAPPSTVLGETSLDHADGP
jgi:hypothetical protein